MAKLLLGSVVGPQGPQGTPGVNGSQGPQGIPGPNEIAATTDVVGLTSGQLLYNNGGKVGSVEIVDNLETEASDKPLSSKMGAWLGYFKRDMEDRGYLFAESKTHFDFANTSGKYKISDASDQPVPGVTASWLVDVTNNGEGGMVQIATCVKGDASALNKIYRRIYISTGGGWQAWKEIPDKSYVDSAIGQIQYKIINSSGSNANGEWIRFEDGTQICRKLVSSPYTDFTSAPALNGTTWKAEIGAKSFPADFISDPVVLWDGDVRLGENTIAVVTEAALGTL